MADIVQIETPQLYIELIEHPVIPNTQLAFRPTLQAFVGKRLQSHAHFIHLVLHGFTDSGRKIVEGTGKGG